MMAVMKLVRERPETGGHGKGHRHGTRKGARGALAPLTGTGKRLVLYGAPATSRQQSVVGIGGSAAHGMIECGSPWACVRACEARVA